MLLLLTDNVVVVGDGEYATEGFAGQIINALSTTVTTVPLFLKRIMLDTLPLNDKLAILNMRKTFTENAQDATWAGRNTR
jgi:hypothetical protein